MAAFTFPTKSDLITLINTYLQTSGTILATEHNDIETSLVNAIYGGQVGDIKEISCDLTYITNNFIIGTSDINEGRALSTSDRYGWAICNGKNGTCDKRGKVGIGYDPINYPIGSIGGARTHTLSSNEMPIHSHPTQKGKGAISGGGGDGWGDGAINTTDAYPLISNSNNGSTGTTGGGLAHNNMQPYIVTLFIQRIAPY